MQPVNPSHPKLTKPDAATLPKVEVARISLRSGIEWGITSEEEIKKIVADPYSDFARKRIPEIFHAIREIHYVQAAIQEALQKPEAAGIDRDATIAAFRILQRGREIGFLTNAEIEPMLDGTPKGLEGIVNKSKTIEVLISLAERFTSGGKLAEDAPQDIEKAYHALVEMHESGRLTDAELAECMQLGMDQFISRGKDYRLLLNTIESFKKSINGYFVPHKIRQKALEMLARARTREEAMAANAYAL